MIRWSPHVFESVALKQNYNPQYLLETIKYSNFLHASNLPIIFSLAHLSKITNSSYKKLYFIVDRSVDPYKQFKITKRSGGYRKITVPNFHLMELQKWINQHILAKGKTHPSAYAYVTGRNIKQNGEIHCGTDWLIKMDIQRFFESITEKQVYKVFHNFGYSKILSLELSRICTRTTTNLKKAKSNRWKIKANKYRYYQSDIIGYLPQGTPTSPALSNLIFFEIDKKITTIANTYGCIYTRYSDDLTFSTNNFDRNRAKQLISDISTLLSKYGFSRNHKKTKIIPPGAKKIVNGLIINSHKPTVNKELKIKIDNHLYYSKKFGVLSHCERQKFRSLLGFKNHLEGLINYVKSIDKDLGSKYYEEFKKIDWPIV